MATQIVIPEVGESVTSGVIAAWTKSDGDWVERDETVLELETDKITMEVPAPAAGILKHSAEEGDTVDVGQSVGTIDESAEKPDSKTAKEDAGKEAAEDDAPAAEREKSKAESGEPAGGAPAKPESLTSTIDAADKKDDKAASPADANGDARATPLARKLAEERGIDLSRVRGTGAGNRIREQDVLAYVQSTGSASRAAEDKTAETPAAAGPSRATSLERMSPMRQRIAARLVEAQQTAAMLTTFNEVDMSAVMATRSRYKETFEKKHGIGLGFMSFFVKAAVGALRAYPLVNAYIVTDDEGRPAVRKHDYCDVAIAVASPKGLVVPVIRNVEAKSFADIESTIKEFAGRAKDGKLTLEEMQGGTFTITNGGVFGSLMSTPILNPPQSAILGMHTIKNRPVEDPDNPGQVVLRPMMYLALSYDHRIVDGADAVRFLVSIKDSIEDPRRLLFDL